MNIVPALIYFIGAIAISLAKGNYKKAVAVIISIVAAINISLIQPQTSWITKFLDFEIILLHADKLSLFVGYIFILIGLIATLYVLHIEDSKLLTLAYIYVGSSLGVVFAGDYLSLYLFWEIMALSSTGLIWLKREKESIDAGYRYLIMHLIGGALLLGGILFQYQITGSLEVVELSKLAGHNLAPLASYLIMAGIGLNAAFILLHTWLPDAYPRAPFYGTIFMSVYTTKTAVYLLARVAPGFEGLAYLGATMTIVGVTMALLQSNARKLLSYHMVSQIGYMVAGIGLGSAAGVDGGVFHLFNNVLYKSLLFMAIGAIIYRVEIEDLSKLGGIMRRMPVTTACAIVAALSISGVPPFNGFVSKGLIFEAAHSNYTIYLMLELAAVGTLLSFLKFTYFGFIRQNKEIELKAVEVPWNMKVAMLTTATLCLLAGLFPGFMFQFLPEAIEAHVYAPAEILGSALLIAATVAGFIFGRKAFEPHTRVTFDLDHLYLYGSKLVQKIGQLLDWINNQFESALIGAVRAIPIIKAPIVNMNKVLSGVLFSAYVDMWLFRPVSARFETDETSKTNKTRLSDVLIDNIGRTGERISNLSASFDLKIIDGIVNGVGWVIVKTGNALKPLQTGSIQSYAIYIIAGSITAVILISYRI